MSWFFRRKKDSAPRTPVEVLADPRFLSLIRDHCTRLGYTARFDAGVVHFARNHDICHTHTLGLSGLAELCSKSLSSDWPTLIDSHIAKLLAQRDELQSTLPDLDDFNAIRPHLSLQFFPDDNSQTPLNRLVTRHDLPGLATTLILDLPNSTATVSPEQAACWQTSREDLFSIALDNLDKKRPRPNMVAVQVESFGQFELAEGPEFTTPACVLLFSRHPRMSGPGGTLLTVPTHSHFLKLKLPDLSIPDPAIPRLTQMMLSMSQKRTESTARSLTSRLYWSHDGSFTEIPYAASNILHAHLTAPAALRTLLPNI